MRLNTTLIALAAIALCNALPAAAQTTITMQAEGMTRTDYAVDGSLIKATSYTTPGTATQAFSGASGTYNIQVFVQPETDGRPTLAVRKGSTLLTTYTYPLSSVATSFTISNVAIASGETIKLVGTIKDGAHARVDKIVFTPVAATTGSTTTGSTTTSPDTTTTTSTTPTTSIVPTTPTAECANPSNGYEGFGRNTTGGAGKPVYRVTNLNDSGAGSLRDALSQGNRCVVFDVGGTIPLSGTLIVRGANVTIDGLTAPAPGITLTNRTLVMQGSSGAGNVVVRGIRARGTLAGEDAMRVYNASNIVFDRVSVSGFGDEAVDIYENSRDVLIQWSILGAGNPAHNFTNLIANNSSRVTVHHNLYINGADRQPKCDGPTGATSATSEIVCDVRNNVMWNYKYYGTRLDNYVAANVVNNYYYSPDSSATTSKTIYVAAGSSAYVVGNYSKNGWDVNASGNRSTPHTAPAPTTTDAITAAGQVVGYAGARGPRFGLDQVDLGYLGQIPIAASATAQTGSTGDGTTTSTGGLCSTATCALQ